MSINLTREVDDFCGNICNLQKEFCVKPDQFPGPYFCIDKNLLKRGLRFKKVAEKLMKRNNIYAASANGVDLLSFFVLVFAIVTLILTLFELYKLRKINKNANSVHELQSFDNINHVDRVV